MDEKKFNIVNLAMDTIILKISALTNEWVRNLLNQILITDRDLSEKSIALALDDIYEFGILQEHDDVDLLPLKKVIEAFMKELPNVEEYKKLYNWDI